MSTEMLQAAAPVRVSRRTAGLLRQILLRRIWLPEQAYAAIPWFYLGAGLGALVGGLYLPRDSWILPYLVLMGVAIAHAGVVVASMRQKARAKRRATGC
jgi:hypothetical protein